MAGHELPDATGLDGLPLQRAVCLVALPCCGRRVAVLYGGAVFACRHCHKLAYNGQWETPDDRATRRANKLRDRLGWEAGILNGAGDKPKGMHWQTFWRMQASHDAHVMQALAGMSAKLGLTMARLDRISRVTANYVGFLYKHIADLVRTSLVVCSIPLISLDIFTKSVRRLVSCEPVNTVERSLPRNTYVSHAIPTFFFPNFLSEVVRWRRCLVHGRFSCGRPNLYSA